MTDYRDREIGKIVSAALADIPVVVITGMRQTGKSTFLQCQSGLEGRRYVSLDDFARLAAAKQSPEHFLADDEPLTIDEAQRVPELLDVIKRKVDEDRRPGRFLLSGSASFPMLKGITESLAGRAIYFTMHPFTRREIKGTAVKKPFLLELLETGRPPQEEAAIIREEEILIGGMPSVCLNKLKNKAFWFKGYEQTYLERDIRQISQISDMIPFKNLLE